MSKNKKIGFGKFLLGAALGTGIGMLFAPKKGEELRKDLAKKIDELLSKAKEVEVDDVKETIEAKIYEIKSELEDLDKEKVLKIAKKKAKDIKDMADELVNYAIEKGTPVLEKTAIAVKEKAIDVTKDVLKKLEEK